MLYTSLADADGMERLAVMAQEAGRNNIAFICLFLLNRVDECTKLLSSTGLL
jgi:coatomer subunit beta'